MVRGQPDPERPQQTGREGKAEEISLLSPLSFLSRFFAPLLVFIGVTVVMTYPLTFRLADALQDKQDPLLNVWILAWEAHQLISDPLRLFDANIFYPYRQTLAFSEILLPNALLALPILLLTGNPVLSHNLVYWLTFVLSGWAAYLLVAHLTHSRSAGLVAGLIFAFSPYRSSHLSQLQMLTMQWMPLAFLALERFLRRGAWRDASLLAFFFVLQTLSSFYYGLHLATGILIYLTYRAATAVSGKQ